MRLDDFDPNINVEDQRGQSFGGGGFGGGGGEGGLIVWLLAMVFSRFGCVGVIVAVGLLAFLGVGQGLISTGGQVGGPLAGSGATQQQSAPAGGGGAKAACTVDAASRAACDAFSSADKTWQQVFSRSGQRFEAPRLVFYSGRGQSACGSAQSAMGPFYCPGDQSIYLDTGFFDELANRFGAKGDFARDYVIAHEFGHHIQNLLGTSDQVAAGAHGATSGSVRLELQADCYAGVWAALNKDRMDPGDAEAGLRAASAIGDDTLQKETQGEVVPDSFTHGTSAERVKWLRRGLDSGDPGQCDTFSGGI